MRDLSLKRPWPLIAFAFTVGVPNGVVGLMRLLQVPEEIRRSEAVHRPAPHLLVGAPVFQILSGLGCLVLGAVVLHRHQKECAERLPGA